MACKTDLLWGAIVDAVFSMVFDKGIPDEVKAMVRERSIQRDWLQDVLMKAGLWEKVARACDDIVESEIRKAYERAVARRKRAESGEAPFKDCADWIQNAGYIAGLYESLRIVRETMI